MNPGNAKPASTGKAMNWLEGKIAYSMGFGAIVLLLTGVGLFYFATRTASVQVVRI